MVTSRLLALPLIGCLSVLQAQNPAMNGNMAWQMQQQQMQSQRMFQMQQQMQRNIQLQQQMMLQQRQMQQQQAAAQATAQRIQREARMESAARRVAALPPPFLNRPSRETWKDSWSRFDAIPAFDGIHVAFVSGNEPILHGLDVASGKTLWEAAIGKAPDLDPMFVGDDLIYGTPDRQLVVLDADLGKERHRLKLDALGSFFMSNRSNHAKILFPAIEGQTMILATFGKGPAGPTGWIYAIDLTSWEIRWKQEFFGGPDLSPQIHGDRVIVGGNGRFLALNLADGKPLWDVRVAGEEEVKDGPLLGDRLVCVCDKKLMAVELKEGKVLWTVPYRSWFMPTGEGERVLYAEDRGWIVQERWIVAVDAATGKKAWELKVGNSRLPWTQDGKVFCNAYETLLALDLPTGKQLWSHALKAAPALPLTVAGEAIYTVHKEGGSSRLTALRLQDGTPVWEHAYTQNPADGLVFLTQKGFLIRGSGPSLLLLE